MPGANDVLRNKIVLHHLVSARSNHAWLASLRITHTLASERVYSQASLLEGTALK
jgi:hypothetical protein